MALRRRLRGCAGSSFVAGNQSFTHAASGLLAGIRADPWPRRLFRHLARGRAIFLPRYLIPSALGISILASAWAAPSKAGKGTAVTLLSFALLLLPIATALLAHPTGLNVARVDQIAAGRAVVCDSLKDFMVMTRYSAHPNQAEYPLDEAAASTVPGVDTDVVS